MQTENDTSVASNASHQDLLDEITHLRAKLATVEADSITWNRQLKAFSNSLHFGFWEWNDAADCPIRFSTEMGNIFGLSLDEIYHRCQSIAGYHQLIFKDDLAHYKRESHRVLEGNGDLENGHIFDYRIVLPNGGLRYVRELEFGEFDEHGHILKTYGVIQDITEFRETADALELSEERVSNLLDQLPVGVQEEDYSHIKNTIDKLVDKGVDNIQEYLENHPLILRSMVAGTSITRVNQALVDIHEADTKEKLIAEEANLDRWWNAEWVEFYAREITALTGGERYFDIDRVDSKLDGSNFETRSITTLVKGHEDDWKRVITIIEDITDRKQGESELIEAKTLAENASQAKSEFLSGMSHELRTPLNAILGFSQLFQYDDDLNLKQKSNALEINRAGKHLLTLIDEILDISRIEAGEADISLGPVSLSDIIGESLSWVEKLAENRSVELKFDLRVLNNVLVIADTIRLKQVFLNLFTNAVKYNNEGGRVYLDIEYREEGKICIGVCDTGWGIDEDKLDDLFQPFKRLGAEFGNTEGTGIGLVITRQLIELMHGKLEVESSAGVGSTFWVELTLAEKQKIEPLQNESARGLAEDVAPALSMARPYILIAEDNPVNRELIASQMDILGYEADYAADGVEALEKWKAGKYYLLITDIRMPRMDGYELIREIRSLDITGTHEVSIIAVTANAMESDIEQCIEAGADEMISKPLELETFREVLENRIPREIEENKNELEEQLDTLQAGQLIDQSVLQQAVGDKPKIHRQLLQSFIKSLPEITNEIEDAFAWHNHQKLAEAAHKLKSSSRSMGAMELGDTCQTLEIAGREKQWTVIEEQMPVFFAYVEQLENSIKDLFNNDQAAQRTPAIQQLEDASIPQIDLSVLVVDDDYIMHRVTTTILNDLGISHVMNALSGPQGLEIIFQQKTGVDLIICDLNMPDMDGIEFIRHLSEQNYKNSLVLASGEDIRMLRTVEKLAFELELQVLGVVEKPITHTKISEVLEAYSQDSSDVTIIKTEQFVVEELVHAIDEDEFDIFFQPKVDMLSRRVVGVEALIRWFHPGKGLIRPDEFVHMAEENQLIDRLTQLVCEKTIAYATRLQKFNFDLNVAINISVDSLSNLDWPDEMAALTQGAGLRPSSITFEITESRLMEHISIALDILSRLSLKRFNLSIDDFGTGYSSMEQLQRIPFSELKIDRAFVNGAAGDNSARAILESSVLLAQKLNMKVVAEGVENQQDWDLLKALGVDQVQGYFISKPLPFDHFVAWLEKWQQKYH